MSNQEPQDMSGQNVPVPTGETTPEPVYVPEDEEGRERGLAEAWREVAEQLRVLGMRLATAFRAAWQSESKTEAQAEEEQAVRDLGDDLRALADRLDRVIKRVAGETEEERAQAARVARDASERSLSEARVAAVQAMHALSRQLGTFAERLEQREGAARDASAGDEPAEQPPIQETETGPEPEEEQKGYGG